MKRNMKRLSGILSYVVAGLCIMGTVRVSAQGGAYERWHGDKYSMFIHFGLYSVAGGVWDGEPVREGYSEQIQSFAGIFSDWYARMASTFDPRAFDAAAIARLAREAGMRSVVFTAKHHDGFCMFRTATTDFNSWDATPVARDFVGELAEACRREGLRLGIYFSNIDWHYPAAYPISSHNADFIPAEHFEYNKAQVRELLTTYGPISELWFDMGSYTPEQSREMYALVHELQPDCMVSGRLGNDACDFAVMADNAHPDRALQMPWQMPASMFPETWGYRSWQERGSVGAKVEEKLSSLLSAVSHGGNYLLNIGPAGDGSVVPFERDVLLAVGRWLSKYGEAVYDTEASPYAGVQWWHSTRRGDTLYVMTPDAAEESEIRIPAADNRLVGARSLGDGAELAFRREGSEYVVARPAAGDIYGVAALEFERDVEMAATEPLRLRGGTRLTQLNGEAACSYSCFDYYSNFLSRVSLTWSVASPRRRGVELLYPASYEGRTVAVSIDGEEKIIRLEGGTAVALDETADKDPSEDLSGVRIVRREWHGPAFGIFDSAVAPWAERAGRGIETSHGEVKSHILENYFLTLHVESDAAREVLFDVVSGNGVEVWLNGRTWCKHLNPYRCTRHEEQVALPLDEGDNVVVVRFYNRFEKSMPWGFEPAREQRRQRQAAGIELPAGVHTVSVRAADRPSPHADMGLDDLVLRVL